jgi:SAM-dependent methyltransferase
MKNDLLDILKCIECQTGKLELNLKALTCQNCGCVFPVISECPILLRRDNLLFGTSDYFESKKENNAIFDKFNSIIPLSSINLSKFRVLKNLKSKIDTQGFCSILVVGCGRQREWLDPLLNASVAHRVVYSDIDSGADVDLFCDGHDLPFIDGAFDAVVTTAVLEHVLYPERVASEISRVLKPGGLLYSELPFMQQVHEGAYDFTRFTLSGHRRLFNQFAEIDVGMVAGPATAFVWALENLILAFAESPSTRKLAKFGVRLGFGWIKYLDFLLVNRPQAMDGASCTYFFGTKAQERVPDSEIVARYIGAKAIRHV